MYVDVLVVLNLYINYFLIRATALITRRECSRKRCVPAAFVGALGSLVILLPELPFLVVVLFKLALGVLIMLIAFGRQKISELAVCVLFFLIVTFTFGGVMLALWTFAPLGRSMMWSNGTAYFNIPISAIIAFTAAAYCAVRLARFIADRRLHCDKISDVKISLNGLEITLRGLCDTGCGLCDIFSGKPVIVCRFDSVAALLPQNVLDYFNGKIPENLRVIPCRTIAAEALIPIFKAEISIDGKSADGFVGVTKNPLGEGVDCIFNPKIISL